VSSLTKKKRCLKTGLGLVFESQNICMSCEVAYR
jgi:hypothetical protein